MTQTIQNDPTTAGPVPTKPGKSREFFSLFRSNIFLLVVSIVMSLLLAEGAVRIYFRLNHRDIYRQMAQRRSPDDSHFVLKDIIAPSSNARLIYELIPNRSGWFFGKTFRTNSFGMRGPEAAKVKPEGVWRIAALGDSTMFGWGVKQDENYAAVLQEALNAAGDSIHYEVLNFAVPGYNTAMEAEVYKALAAGFSPDLILIQFDINDLALPNFVLEPPGLLTFERSYLVALINSLFKGRDAREGLAQLAGNELQAAPLIDAPSAEGIVKYFEYRSEFTPERYRYMVGWEGVRRALDDLWKMSRRPVVHLSWIYPVSKKKLTDFGDIDHFSLHVKEGRKNRDDGDRLYFLEIESVGREFCRELGLRWVRDLVVDYPNDYHPSPVRHILIARRIYLFLVENRLLPGESLHYQTSDTIAQWLWDRAKETAGRK